MKEVLAAYNTDVRSMTDEQKAAMHSPHIFVWDQALQALLVLTKDKDQHKIEHDAIQSYLNQLDQEAADILAQAKSTSTPDLLMSTKRDIDAMDVKIMRVLRCWDPKMMRLELNTRPGSAAAPIGDIMLKLLQAEASGIMKQSQAPRGKLERKLQAWLKKVSSKDGDDAVMEGPF